MRHSERPSGTPEDGSDVIGLQVLSERGEVPL